MNLAPLLRCIGIAGLAGVLAVAAPAQTVTEVGGMSVAHSFIDMDALPLGMTDTAALNAAGTHGGATMASLGMTAKGAAAGVYNTQVCGQALAAGPGTVNIPHIIAATGTAAFDAMTVQIDFGGPCTEFGLLIGDWVGPAVIRFYAGGALVYTHTSSTFTLCGAQFYRMSGGSFDFVDLDVSTTAGNWCLMELYVEQVGPSGPTLAVSGLVAGGTATVTATNCTPGAIVRGAWSLAGGGPTMTSKGVALLTMPVRFLRPTRIADPHGTASWSGQVPVGMTGTPIWIQAYDNGTQQFTNGLAEVIG